MAAPELPCEDAGATLREYAAVVPPADVVVGHSLGGLTIPLVPARRYVYLCALVAPWGRPTSDIFAERALLPGFPEDGVARDDEGRSAWVDEAVARRMMYADCDDAAAAGAFARLRPQGSAIYAGDYPLGERPEVPVTSMFGADDRAVDPAWSRRVAPERLGVDAMEIEGGHSPMLARPAELAALLDHLA